MIDVILGFGSPPLLSSRLAHRRPLLGGEHRHPTLPARLAAFTAHSGHDLGDQRHADSDWLLGFPYGLQDYAAGVLNGIKSFLCSTSAFWHRALRVARERARVKMGGGSN